MQEKCAVINPNCTTAKRVLLSLINKNNFKLELKLKKQLRFSICALLNIIAIVQVCDARGDAIIIRMPGTQLLLHNTADKIIYNNHHKQNKNYETENSIYPVFCTKHKQFFSTCYWQTKNHWW